MVQGYIGNIKVVNNNKKTCLQQQKNMSVMFGGGDMTCLIVGDNSSHEAILRNMQAQVLVLSDLPQGYDLRVNNGPVSDLSLKYFYIPEHQRWL